MPPIDHDSLKLWYEEQTLVDELSTLPKFHHQATVHIGLLGGQIVCEVHVAAISKVLRGEVDCETDSVVSNLIFIVLTLPIVWLERSFTMPPL